MIREIQIDNFKSIESLKLELGRFNVLIGANGCGKSNILEAITFGAAAPIVKLTNEFLSTRGIRMTEPALMQSAFVEQNFNKGISLYFSNDEKENITYFIKWENDVWKIRFLIDEHKSNVIHKTGVPNNVQVLENGDFIFGDIVIKLHEEMTENFLEKYAESINTIEEESKNFIHKNELSDFLIFAPENYFLRNIVDENQIKPLGIRGEGLFRHLATIGYKNPSIFNEIKYISI